MYIYAHTDLGCIYLHFTLIYTHLKMNNTINPYLIYIYFLIYSQLYSIDTPSIDYLKSPFSYLKFYLLDRIQDGIAPILGKISGIETFQDVNSASGLFLLQC